MRKTARALTAIAAAGILALSGCSGGSGSKSGGGSEDTVAQVNPKDRSELKQGGTLRLPISSLPSNWNNSHIEGNEGDISDMLDFVEPRNWIYQPDGIPQPNKNYLESFSVKEASADSPQVVTLKLNPKAKWNSGEPITWEDYAQSAKVCNGENNSQDAAAKDQYACASTDGWNSVAKVEKGADEFEVVTTFKSAYPDWSALFSTVFKKDSIKDPQTFNEGWKTDMPNNNWLSGPFKISKVDKSAKLVTMVPNENWWGEKPLLDSVEWRELKSDAIPGAFANNEIDTSGGIIDANTYQTVIKRADAEVRRGLGVTWRHYTFNSKTPILADQKLRQALAMGLDRAQTAKSDLAGISVIKPEELLLGNHFFMPGQEGYVDNSKDTTPFDKAKAEALLDELGWKKEEGKEFRTKDGKELEIKYLSITGISTSENEGKMLQDQMKNIGVKITIVQSTSNEFFKKVQAGEFEITAFSWVGTPYPMRNVGQIYSANGGSNFPKLTIPKVDELIPKIASETDHKKRIDLTNEADKAIWEAVHTVPIYQRVQLIAVPKNLANWGAFGISTGHPENIGYLK